jgi:hypothetical protein
MEALPNLFIFPDGETLASADKEEEPFLMTNPPADTVPVQEIVAAP